MTARDVIVRMRQIDGDLERQVVALLNTHRVDYTLTATAPPARPAERFTR